MAETVFLLELGESGYLTSLSAPFPESCEQANWLARDTLYACITSQHRPHTLLDSKCVIPVGSIQFVDRFLISHGLKPIQAMNIPPELEQERFLARRIFRDVGKEQLPQIEKSYGPLLIKPGRRPKLFEAARSKDFAVVLPNDEPLFVSQFLSEAIVAEWRVFLLRGRIIDIRPYVLDQWCCPDLPTITGMAQALSRYAALALDVGVLSGGRTVAIECHPFISCGLYGFEGPDMLRMAKAAWLAELRRQGRVAPYQIR